MASNKDRKTKINQDKKGKGAGNVNIRRFIITYLALMIAFHFLTSYQPIFRTINVNEFYTQYIVLITSKILGVFRVPCTYAGTIIALPALSLDVKFGCNGLEAVMMYSIAVAAYPAGWKKKLVGITTGFFILQAANILRIVLLVYSGIYLTGLFEFIHIYIAQGMMIALSLGIFFFYLNHAKNAETVHI